MVAHKHQLRQYTVCRIIKQVNKIAAKFIEGRKKLNQTKNTAKQKFAAHQNTGKDGAAWASWNWELHSPAVQLKRPLSCPDHLVFSGNWMQSRASDEYGKQAHVGTKLSFMYLGFNHWGHRWGIPGPFSIPPISYKEIMIVEDHLHKRAFPH